LIDMNLFIKYYLILILAPIVVIEIIPESFYKIKIRYPLFLCIQIFFISLLMYLSFRSEFPLISEIPIYDLFEIKFMQDTGSSLFLISFSVSMFVLLLRLTSEERKKLTLFITAIFLIAFSGNTITFFVSSFLFLIISQMDIKDKVYGHLTDSIPLILMFCAFSLVLLTGQKQSSYNVLNNIGYLPNSSVALFLIMSAFFLPLLLSITDVLFHSSSTYADTKLFITSTSFLYIMTRFTASLNKADAILNISFLLFFILTVGIIIILILFQRRNKTSFFPLMVFYLLFLSLSFISIRLSGQPFIHQNYLYGFSLYFVLFVTADDCLSVLNGNPGRFALITAIFAFLVFNPWMNSGIIFNTVLFHVFNSGPAYIIIFVTTLLLVISASMLSVLSTKYNENSDSSRFTEKYIFFIGIIAFLLILERFF